MQYDLLEMYRMLGELVEKFGLNRRHPALRKAADFILRSQSRYGAQYSPNYTEAILELLIKAGYSNDARVARSFAWLLKIRQSDGGWAIPLRTRKMNFRRLDGPTLLIPRRRSRIWSPELSCPPLLQARAARRLLLQRCERGFVPPIAVCAA